MRYFQNARARRDNSLQVVVAHKRKQALKPCIAPLQCTAKYGVKNYLPSRPAGDTDDTVASMIAMMDAESHKFKPNRSAVADMMDHTFADRRKMIVVEAAGINQVRDKYPCLFNEHEVRIVKISPFCSK